MKGAAAQPNRAREGHDRRPAVRRRVHRDSGWTWRVLLAVVATAFTIAWQLVPSPSRAAVWHLPLADTVVFRSGGLVFAVQMNPQTRKSLRSAENRLAEAEIDAIVARQRLAAPTGDDMNDDLASAVAIAREQAASFEPLFHGMVERRALMLRALRLTAGVELLRGAIRTRLAAGGSATVGGEAVDHRGRPNGVYVSEKTLWAAAILAILPLAARLLLPGTRRSRTRPASAGFSTDTAVRICERPRWAWRIALASVAVLTLSLGSRVRAHVTLGPLPIAGGTRVSITNGCVLVGGALPAFPDRALVYGEAVALRDHARVARIEDQLRFTAWTRVHCRDADARGVAVASFGAGPITIVSGRLLLLPALLLLCPLAVGLGATGVRRGRRLGGRCVLCGYPLRGLSKPRCPECGTQAGTTTDFHRNQFARVRSPAALINAAEPWARTEQEELPHGP